jgi:hypothetical protein
MGIGCCKCDPELYEWIGGDNKDRCVKLSAK